MNMDILREVDKEIYDAIIQEIEREEFSLELIASENFVSRAVLAAQGSVLTNKYAEGYPSKRYYGGCEFVDVCEELAIERAKKIFNCDHVNVQPHSGTSANIAVYLSVLEHGDTIMGMSLSDGGHLSHGSPVNLSGKFFNVVPYGVEKDSETIDYDKVEEIAIEHKPKMIVFGASAYPRILDFHRFREICDRVGAYMFVDIAHIAGLVAAGLHPSPVPYADFVTTTTHKTLRGPRAGIIMCKKDYAKKIDKTVFPGIQGGPLMHAIAAKAVAFKEAMSREFKEYQKQVVANARKFAIAFHKRGYRLVSGGTDTHLLLVDMRPKELTGKEVETILWKAGITVNKNSIPFDPQKFTITSGIRIGTPAITTRGMKEAEIVEIADLIDEALICKNDDGKLAEIKSRVELLCKRFPLYADMLKQ